MNTIPRRPAVTVTVLIATTLAVSLAGCGSDHDDSGAHDDAAVTSADSGLEGEQRVVEITMADIRFEPEAIEVEQGETIVFRFTNEGAIPHDAFVGTAAEQDDHEAEMAAAAADGSDDGHEHAGHMNAVTVQPGDTQTITHTFDEAGELEIGCHQPGHYDAGMKVSINVE